MKSIEARCLAQLRMTNAMLAVKAGVRLLPDESMGSESDRIAHAMLPYIRALYMLRQLRAALAATHGEDHAR